MITFKKLARLCFAFFLLTITISCHDSGQEIAKGQVNFSIAPPILDSKGGRIDQIGTPGSVIVSVHDANGTMIQDHYKIQLSAFGSGFVSSPLLMDVTDQQSFYLSEFIVVDNEDNVLYASPKEGSPLAHLVSDPLDIQFNVTADQTTTVTPEVIAVDNSSPEQFGYSEFGFNVMNKIEVVVSAFTDLQLTDAHIKFEGLQDNTVLWTYETELLAKANIVALKTSASYRITVTKDGFEAWQNTMTLNESANLNIALVKIAAFDTYSAGQIGIPGSFRNAVYFKNRLMYLLDDKTQSTALDLAVQNTDIYNAGYRTVDYAGHTFYKACYWKNTSRVDLSFYGMTNRVIASGSDIYISGYSLPSADYSGTRTGFFLKNDVKTDLSPLTMGASVTVNDMTVVGNDVYLVGTETLGNVTNGLLWKNSEVKSLPANFEPTAIAIKNEHVYIAGNLDHQMSLMKDSQITSFLNEVDARDVIVTDSEDVYVLSGRGDYYKNGNVVRLANEVTNMTPQANAIAVGGDLVYVAGGASHNSEIGHQPTMCYWIGGLQNWGVMNASGNSMLLVSNN